MQKPILIITDTLIAGGIEQQLTYLSIGLKKKGYTVHILCLYGEKVGRKLRFAETLNAAAIPIKVLDLSYSPQAKARAVYEIIAEAWRLQAIAIQCFNYHSNLLARMARPFLPSNTRLIGSVRNDYSPHQLRLEKLSWRFCKNIVINSPHMREALESVGIPRAKIKHIANGLDISRFENPPENLAEKGQRTLVMMGRISRQKSPHLLAEALGLLKQDGLLPEALRVYIVGQVDTHPAHKVQDLLDKAIAKYELGEIVLQEESTNQPERYYHAADFTVLASLYEGLPNAMLESLAVGKPVLISDAANRANVIEEGITGWIVPSNDTRQLADKLKEVFSLSQEALNQMSSACRAKAQEFSIERMVEKHCALYED